MPVREADSRRYDCVYLRGGNCAFVCTCACLCVFPSLFARTADLCHGENRVNLSPSAILSHYLSILSPVCPYKTHTNVRTHTLSQYMHT